MKVLVTGATSLIGAHVVDRLSARGDVVTAFQRGITAHPSTEPAGGHAASVSTVLGDITDAAAVAAAVDGHDAVVHLAAKVGRHRNP